MTAADLAEERLRDEFDLLCMPPPSAVQIAVARARGARAEGARHAAA